MRLSHEIIDIYSQSHQWLITCFLFKVSYSGSWYANFILFPFLYVWLFGKMKFRSEAWSPYLTFSWMVRMKLRKNIFLWAPFYLMWLFFCIPETGYYTVFSKSLALRVRLLDVDFLKLLLSVAGSRLLAVTAWVATNIHKLTYDCQMMFTQFFEINPRTYTS